MGCFIKLTTTVVLLAGVQLCFTEKTHAAILETRDSEIEMCRTMPESFGDIACPHANPDPEQDPNAPGATGAGGGR